MNGPSVRETCDPLEQAQIDLLRSLDDGEGQVLAEIVAEYLSVSEQERVELLQMLDAGDCLGLARGAHTLKGASANVGAGVLASVCAGLELQARQGQLEEAHELMDQFEVEFTRARAALQVVATGT